MPLPVIHDPAARECLCHFCCQERYREKCEEQMAAERIATRERERDSRLRSAQLRFPIPLPHCADQPRTFAAAERQTEFAL